MPVSPTAHARAQSLAAERIGAQKAEYAEKLRRILVAAAPSLTPAELSVGLDLGEREVSRFLSTAPRTASARPDGELRALIDSILAGTLVVAARSGAAGARRDVLVADPAEARRLDRTWSLLPLGATVDLRSFELEADDPWGMGLARSRARAPIRTRALLGGEVYPMIFGAMRLSTLGRPANAADVLRAALDAGFQVFDTADSYGLDEADLGHSERLIGEVARGRAARVITKAGLRRPAGRWVPDASPQRLRSACEASLHNLGVDQLDLLLLHVVDPKVPLAESVGALARLKEEGKVAAVGLSNVDAAQLDAARTIVAIAAVQNELNRFHADGLEDRCAELGIPYLAHRPLGGHGRAGKAPDGVVARIATKLGASPAQVTLAWHLARGVWPVVGATTVAHVRDAAAAATLPLDSEDLAALGVVAEEVVLIAGPPAAGKTSRVGTFVDRGYTRLNRDLIGGSLAGLIPLLKQGLAAGQRRWVLDNTYGTRSSRAAVVDAAKAHRVPVRVMLVATPRGEALYNACRRMIQRYGRLLEPGEQFEENDIPPQAIHRYFQTWERPVPEEGINAETAPFSRGRTGTRRALFLDLDGTVRHTRSGAPFPRHPDDVVLLPGRKELLARYHREGWLLLGVSNQSGIARGEVSPAEVAACVARTVDLLDLPLEVRWCPHPAGEIRCWCRKPMPGLGVAWIEARDVDREQSRMVGDLDSDRVFAENLGVAFTSADTFFSPG